MALRGRTSIVLVVVLCLVSFAIGLIAATLIASRRTPDEVRWERDSRALREAFDTEGLVPTREGEDWRVQLHNGYFGPENNLLPADFLEIGEFRQRAVGKLMLVRGNQRASIGTAWLVNDEWAITAGHIWKKWTNPGEDFVLRLPGPDGKEWDLNASRENEASYSSSSLDYTVFKVTRLEGEAAKHIEPLDLRTLVRQQPPERGDAMNIVQFAGGRFKQVTLQENDLLALDEGERYLYYTSDTEDKSSGAPVFNNDWSLVGLHTGFDDVKVDSETIRLNEGIDIFAIIVDIRERAPDAIRNALGIPAP
jgi:V8-like Glu-specific endopeptidase